MWVTYWVTYGSKAIRSTLWPFHDPLVVHGVFSGKRPRVELEKKGFLLSVISSSAVSCQKGKEAKAPIVLL